MLPFLSLLILFCLSICLEASQMRLNPPQRQESSSFWRWCQSEHQVVEDRNVSSLISGFVEKLVHRHHRLLSDKANHSPDGVSLEFRLNESRQEWVQMTRLRRSSRPRIRVYLDDLLIRDFCSTHNYPTVHFNVILLEHQSYYPILACQPGKVHNCHSGLVMIYAIVTFICVISVITVLIAILNTETGKARKTSAIVINLLKPDEKDENEEENPCEVGPIQSAALLQIPNV